MDNRDARHHNFEKYDADRPEVYAELVRLTRAWVESGRTRCGIGMLFEVLRWQTKLARTDDGFVLPHQHRAYYARRIMLDHPDLTGVFALRASHADSWAEAYRARIERRRDR